MDSSDFSHISLPSQDRLLSESLIFGSRSSEPDNSDLLLSDLSIKPDRAREKRPFSLLARPLADETVILDDEQQGDANTTMTQEDMENAKRQAARTREEKLQHDLFVLKKLNSAFEVYKGALQEAKSATDVCSHHFAGNCLMQLTVMFREYQYNFHIPMHFLTNIPPFSTTRNVLRNSSSTSVGKAQKPMRHKWRPRSKQKSNESGERRRRLSEENRKGENVKNGRGVRRRNERRKKD